MCKYNQGGDEGNPAGIRDSWGEKGARLVKAMYQFRIKHFLAAVLACAIVVTLLSLAKKVLMTIYAGNSEIGRVESLTEWPGHLDRLRRQVLDDNGRLVNLTLYHIDRRDYFLQCSTNATTFEWLRSRLDLVKCDTHDAHVQSFNRLMEDVPSVTIRTKGVKYYWSRSLLPDEEDDRYVVAYNKDNEQLTLLYYRLF